MGPRSTPVRPLPPGRARASAGRAAWLHRGQPSRRRRDAAEPSTPTTIPRGAGWVDIGAPRLRLPHRYRLTDRRYRRTALHIRRRPSPPRGDESPSMAGTGCRWRHNAVRRGSHRGAFHRRLRTQRPPPAPRRTSSWPPRQRRAAARGQMASGKPSAAPGELHPAGHLELVTTERHRAHRYSAAERLLGDAHAAVGDHADRAAWLRLAWAGVIVLVVVRPRFTSISRRGPAGRRSPSGS